MRKFLGLTVGILLTTTASAALAESDAAKQARLRYEESFREVVRARTDLDRQVALSTVISAARHGYFQAYTLLGTLLTQDDFLPSDPAMAARLFEVAAKAGDPTAKNKIGRAHV